MSRAVAVSASLRAALAAPLLAALACGGGGSGLGGDAAAVETGGDVAGTVPTSCELATQAGCAADQQCGLFCESQQLVVACRAEPAAPPAIGEPCMAVPCVRGSTCLATAAMPTATCMKLCAVTADCPSGQGCRDVVVGFACAVTGPKSVRIRACL